MLLTLDTPAAAWPVTLAEAKAQLRVDDTASDDLINSLIAVASAAVSEMSGKEITDQVWTASYASASGDVALPRVPVTSIDSISYFDANGDAQSATVSDFYLFADDTRAVVRPKSGSSWPGLQTREDAISITFSTGFTNVPQELKHAVLLLVSHLFENREASTEANLKEVPLAFQSLINIHRRGWVSG